MRPNHDLQSTRHRHRYGSTGRRKQSPHRVGRDTATRVRSGGHRRKSGRSVPSVLQHSPIAERRQANKYCRQPGQSRSRHIHLDRSLIKPDVLCHWGFSIFKQLRLHIFTLVPPQSENRCRPVTMRCVQLSVKSTSFSALPWCHRKVMYLYI